MRSLFTRLALVFVLLTALAACSSHSVKPTTEPDAKWLRDGMIAFSRPAPEVSTNMPSSMLAFFPVRTSQAGSWLSIDLHSAAINLMDGDKVVASAQGEGVSNLKPGTYQILHKQRNALWYANDNYFKSRKLPVPPQNDRSRYRRGALGDFALFVGEDNPTPLHSGPVWSQEIGGIRLNDDDLSRIYYRIPVGAQVEVK